jgi:hypothetical protein
LTAGSQWNVPEFCSEVALCNCGDCDLVAERMERGCELKQLAFGAAAA